MATLNNREKLFCDEYLGSCKFNATKAAIAAGYAKKSARITASRLLTKDNIQKYLADQGIKLSKKLEITKEKTLQEIARIAFADIRKYYDGNGRLILPKDMDDDAAAALAGIEVFEEFGFDIKGDRVHIGDTKKIKMFNKLSALEILAKHYKLYSDGPAPMNVFNLNNLSNDDLKTLLLIMSKG